MGNAVRSGYKLCADAERPKVCVVFWRNSRKGCVLWWTKPKRRGYRTEIGLLKNEEGMRQSLENVVPW